MTLIAQDALTLSEESLRNLPFILENEIDWPQLSTWTGYMNSTWSVVTPPTQSLYLKMWERNRCNFRFYLLIFLILCE
jgi:acyloxyacyl hydrolase